jgi:hypothetical protein
MPQKKKSRKMAPPCRPPIYSEKYRTELEKSYYGGFVAINVGNGDATLADTGEDAIRLALEKDPTGLFHLVRVGHKAAFEAGWYMSCAS